ncbi:MAG: hypothetical protein K2L81_06935, partial [Muribaculaceae bacterium]|nr:hypothetical protein [Muribaculaceae bacterium]
LINVGPKGVMAMSKAYSVSGVGRTSKYYDNFTDVSPTKSLVRFSVCISYSIDDGQSFEKLVTNFYVSSNINEKADMKSVSKAFNKIYANKPDALVENMYMFIIRNNIEKATTDVMDDFLIHTDINDTYVKGSLVDFQ